MNVLNSFNDIYKGIKPFAEPIVGALPFGNYINKGLDAASTVIDKVQPFTNRWLNDKDKLKALELLMEFKSLQVKLHKDYLIAIQMHKILIIHPKMIVITYLKIY